MRIDKRNVGVCSFAFRYAVGTASFRPPSPMDAFGLIREAERLGFGRVMFFDNIGSDDFTPELCRRIGAALAERGMTACLGVKHLAEDTFVRYLPLAVDMGADQLRVAVPLRGSAEESVSRARDIFADNLRPIEKSGIAIGLENHHSLAPEYVVSLGGAVDHPLVGYIFDSTNSLRFLEKPAATLRRMLGRLQTVHLKDYAFTRLEAGYLLNGAVLGEGEADLAGLLREALAAKPEARVELELSLARPAGMAPEEVVAWEADAVARSGERLFGLLRAVNDF